MITMGGKKIPWLLRETQACYGLNMLPNNQLIDSQFGGFLAALEFVIRLLLPIEGIYYLSKKTFDFIIFQIKKLTIYIYRKYLDFLVLLICLSRSNGIN